MWSQWDNISYDVCGHGRFQISELVFTLSYCYTVQPNSVTVWLTPKTKCSSDTNYYAFRINRRRTIVHSTTTKVGSLRNFSEKLEPLVVGDSTNSPQPFIHHHHHQYLPSINSINQSTIQSVLIHYPSILNWHIEILRSLLDVFNLLLFMERFEIIFNVKCITNKIYYHYDTFITNQYIYLQSTRL